MNAAMQRIFEIYNVILSVEWIGLDIDKVHEVLLCAAHNVCNAPDSISCYADGPNSAIPGLCVLVLDWNSRENANPYLAVVCWLPISADVCCISR